MTLADLKLFFNATQQVKSCCGGISSLTNLKRNANGVWVSYPATYYIKWNEQPQHRFVVKGGFNRPLSSFSSLIDIVNFLN